jgi:spoIIIJ-associated protein
VDWIEVTARTVDDAKELALDRLGVVEDELEVEIVDEPRRGILGMGRGDARIRARVKPISREKPSDRKRRRRPNDRSGGSGRVQGGSAQAGRGQGGGRGGSRGRSGERPRDTSPKALADESQEANQPREANPSSARAPGSGGARRRRGGRGRGSGGGAARVATPSSDERNAEADDKVEAEVDVETVPVTDQADHAARFTDELVRTMGFSASVRTEIDEDDVTVHIEGDGLGALVGPRGATIQALEEVVRAVVQHHAGGHSAWIHVDVAGYRERRRQALSEFARQVAAEVKETGEERAMEPMGAADRKVVHDTISDIDGVDTTSEGEDPRRRVVVLPA